MFHNRIDVAGKLLFVSGGLIFLFGVVSILFTADTEEVLHPGSQEDSNNAFDLPIGICATGMGVLALGLTLSLYRNAARGQEALEAQNPQP